MDSLEQQLRRIEKQLKGNLTKGMNEVAKEVKRIQSEKVKEEVYDSYQPSMYNRRGYDKGDGGLGDINNMKHSFPKTSDGEVLLEVRNETMSNEDFLPDGKSPFEIAGVVEYGHRYQGDVYDYPRDKTYVEPRPFIEATRQELESSGIHVRKLRNSLRKQGIMVD